MKKEILEEMEKFRVSEFEKLAKSSMVPISDGSKLKVFRYTPPKEKFNGYTLFLSVGWGTVVSAWDQLLLEATKDFDVVYYESREKGSSELPKKYAVGMERMAKDIQEIIEYLKLDEKKLILLGSCIGATEIVFGMYRKMYNPFLPVLISPPARFEVPPILRQIIPIGPTFLWGTAQPIVRWWVIKTKTEDIKQAAKYLRTLEEADPKKWKRLGLRLAYKRYWWLFPEVKNHVLLVSAETDKMHNAKAIRKVNELMENSVYLSLSSNKDTHAPIMVEKIREFIPQFKGKNH